MTPLYKFQNPPRPDVVQFGNWVKRQLSIETNEQTAAGTTPIFTSQETSLISERLLNSRYDIAAAYQGRLELGREFYFGVRQHLMAVLQVWDAVIDEKEAFDKFGFLKWNQEFIEAFLLCTDTIPTRVNIGSLGPPNLQSKPTTLATLPVVSGGAPLPFTPKEHGNLVSPWDMIEAESLQCYSPEALTLSDPEVGDAASDYEEDDEDDCYEYEEDYEDVETSMSQDTELVSQNNLDTPSPFLVRASESWQPDPQTSVNDTQVPSDSELSDFEDFASPKGEQTPSPLDLADWSNEPKPIDVLAQLAASKQRYVPNISVVSKKRRLASEEENSVQDEGAAKRRKRCGKTT